MRCVLRGTTGFSRLGIGRCDVGDPRVFGREDWCATSKTALTFLRNGLDLLMTRVENGNDERNERDKDKRIAQEETRRWTRERKRRPVQGARSRVHQRTEANLTIRVAGLLQLRNTV